MKGDWTLGRAGAHWWTVFTAVATFILLCSGGLVTSKGAGMAVPDWPSTFGYNMFFFPVSRWVGGIFYEHTHRLIASGIGLATLLLAVWLLVVEPRRWVKILGGCLFVGVCLQGLLGGLRVTLFKDEIGIFHALLAQSFFVAIAILAVVTSRRFVEKRWADYAPDTRLRNLVLGTTILIFLQLALGATMRHEHIGLSIPDFPLAYGQILPDTSAGTIEKINALRVTDGQMPTNALQIWIQMAHRFVAVLIFGGVFLVFSRARQAAGAIQFWTTCWLGLIAVQIGLGAWTIWSNKAADVATAHMALGALSLLLGGLLSFRLFYGARAKEFILPDAPGQSLMERIA